MSTASAFGDIDRGAVYSTFVRFGDLAVGELVQSNGVHITSEPE